MQKQRISETLYSLNSIHSGVDTDSITRSEEDQNYFSIRSSLEDDLLPLDIPPGISVARSDGVSIPPLDTNQLTSLGSSGTPPSILLSNFSGSPLSVNSTIPISPHTTPIKIPLDPIVAKPRLVDPPANNDCNKFVIKLGGVSVALLHVSITSLYQLPEVQLAELRECLGPDNRGIGEMTTHTQIATLYFHRLNKLAETSELSYITGNLLLDKLTKFAYAIPNDHLRLVTVYNLELELTRVSSYP